MKNRIGLFLALLAVTVGLAGCKKEVPPLNPMEPDLTNAATNPADETPAEKDAAEQEPVQELEVPETQPPETTDGTEPVKSAGAPIVLFHGLDIGAEDLELSIPDTQENREKYTTTYYQYENGSFAGQCQGVLDEIYTGYLQVSNVGTYAISKDYDAVPRSYETVQDLPPELMEFADCDRVEIQRIDLDGDGTKEYVVAYGVHASPEDFDTEAYSNYSEILVFDHNMQKLATLVSAKDQFWEQDGQITAEFFCSLDDVTYLDIDEDGKMEILVDTHIYEGIGVNVYRYENGAIHGKTGYNICALP